MSILRDVTKRTTVAVVMVACAGATLARVARGKDGPRLIECSSIFSQNDPSINETISHTTTLINEETRPVEVRATAKVGGMLRLRSAGTQAITIKPRSDATIAISSWGSSPLARSPRAYVGSFGRAGTPSWYQKGQ